MRWTLAVVLSGVMLTASACTVDGAARQAVMAQFYYMEDSDAFQSLQAHADRIDVLSPAWITVEPGGAMRLSLDPGVLAWAAAHQVALMPLVVNRGFDASIAEAVVQEPARGQAITALSGTARQMGWSGVQLDLENLHPGIRSRFTEFVEQLAAEFHTHSLRLSLAVPAPLMPVTAGGKTEFVPNPRAEAFDYARLAAAADFLSLMAYDEYTAPDQPGPIAGYPWVEASLVKVLEQAPAAKVSLGVSLYHRRWAAGAVSEGSFAQVREMVLKHGAADEFDAIQQAPLAVFTADGAPQVIWFENARSLSVRLGLVKKYGLAGFSAWRLGQEDPAAWDSAFEMAKEKGSRK